MNEIFKKSGNQLLGKLVVLGVLVVITWAATMFVWGVVKDREGRQGEVAAEVAEQWGRAQIVAGPVLSVPVEKTTVAPTGERVQSSYYLYLLPKKLSYDGAVAAQVRSRSVYDTPVYTATVKGMGEFALSDINLDASPDTKILWDKAEVSINVSDPRGITNVSDFTWNNIKYPLIPASKFSVLEKNGMHTGVAIDSKQSQYSFSFNFDLRGSNELAFLPFGEETDLSVTSNWPAPNFTGEFLPETREITPSGFTAKWQVTSFGKNIPQSWSSNNVAQTDDVLVSKAFGVGLYQAVDFYTMVDRSIKYSILFICLTFLTFFLYEVLANLRIHPIQYLLVGLAIALFYLLLLSVAEILGFMLAYLVSTLATTALITSYCVSILKVKKRAFSITGLLIALYAYLYILLQLEDWSLLFGSVFLFGVLGIVMYITRNLDWYTLGEKD